MHIHIFTCACLHVRFKLGGPLGIPKLGFSSCLLLSSYGECHLHDRVPEGRGCPVMWSDEWMGPFLFDPLPLNITQCRNSALKTIWSLQVKSSPYKYLDCVDSNTPRYNAFQLLEHLQMLQYQTEEISPIVWGNSHISKFVLVIRNCVISWNGKTSYFKGNLETHLSKGRSPVWTIWHRWGVSWPEVCSPDHHTLKKKK